MPDPSALGGYVQNQYGRILGSRIKPYGTPKTVIRGDDMIWPFSVFVINGPINLLGSRVDFTAKSGSTTISKNSTDASQIEITSNDGQTIKGNIYILSGDTSSLTDVATFTFDLQVLNNDAHFTPVIGQFLVAIDFTTTP